MNIFLALPNRFKGKLLLTLLVLFHAQAVSAERYYPVDYGRLTSVRGWRIDPFGSGKYLFHQGWDIACPVGTPIYPTQAGVVLFAGHYKGYGLLVAVDHRNGYVTMYGHNSKLLVITGQSVDSTTCISLSGNTGISTGPHVHYEIRVWPNYSLQVQSAENVNDNLKGKNDVADELHSWK
jgi:murein DD-endopeptidase MepM/ murein hydrolase activator NlpD